MTVVELAVVLVGPFATTGLALRARRHPLRRRVAALGNGNEPPPRASGIPVGSSTAPGRVAALRRVGTVAAGVTAAGVALGWVGLAVAAAAAVALGARSHRRRRARAHEARAAALVGLTDRLATELRAGAGLAEALARAGDVAGPLRPALVRVQSRCRLGHTLSGALGAWAAEEPLEAGRHLARALALLAVEGGPVATALEGVAEGLRDEAAVADELRAQSAQARASATVVGAAPLGYLAFGALVDPGSLGLLTGTGTGRACLVAGLVLQVIGWAWIRRILRSAPW